MITNVDRPTVVDLFCGCGGFSLGAELAGFQVIAAVDIDPILQSAHRLNFPTTRTIEASVADLDLSAWNKILGSKRPDGVIGGPPCQGFSRIGKRQLDDPRNSLIGHYFRQILLLRPKFFVMENVPGLLDPGNAEILQAGVASVSHLYDVTEPVIANAENFGAATSRRRVVVVGVAKDWFDAIQPEHFFRATEDRATVRDAIEDLPSPLGDAESKAGWGLAQLGDPVVAMSNYATLLRRAPPSHLGWSQGKAWQASKTISGMAGTRHSVEIAARYASIAPGKADPICKSQKLSWTGRAPTLRAGTGSDKGSFQAVRPLHPEQGRVITVREAARLQSFPDWFVFHPTKWHSFRMIGNSVPPIVSQTLLSRLRDKMIGAIAA